MYLVPISDMLCVWDLVSLQVDTSYKVAKLNTVLKQVI